MAEQQQQQQKQDPLPLPKRYITTHDPATGKAVFSDAFPPEVVPDVLPGMSFFNCYSTASFPADLNGGADLAAYGDDNYPSMGLRLHEEAGTTMRIVDFAPSGSSTQGAGEAEGQQQPKLPPFMHRTVSLDYGVVLEGEVEAVLDSGEARLCRRGDVVVQRGTMHAWRNPSATHTARVAFVLTAIKPVRVRRARGEDGRDGGEEDDEEELGLYIPIQDLPPEMVKARMAAAAARREQKGKNGDDGKGAAGSNL